jgi:GTP-binding protein
MHARFLLSAANAAGFPADHGAEVAFVGRSNSGKSSAINRIMGQGKLARVGKTPGRTQLINFFDLGLGRRLVDLPGYGFARVPARVRRDWGELVAAYFADRRSLKGLILTVDSRRGLGEGDWRMLDWARDMAVPVLLLLTKADKLSRGAAASARLAVLAELDAEADAEALSFSALTGAGAEAAKARLLRWLEPEGSE